MSMSQIFIFVFESSESLNKGGNRQGDEAFEPNWLQMKNLKKRDMCTRRTNSHDMHPNLGDNFAFAAPLKTRKMF